MKWGSKQNHNLQLWFSPATDDLQSTQSQEIVDKVRRLNGPTWSMHWCARAEAQLGPSPTCFQSNLLGQGLVVLLLVTDICIKFLILKGSAWIIWCRTQGFYLDQPLLGSVSSGFQRHKNGSYCSLCTLTALINVCATCKACLETVFTPLVSMRYCS